MITTLKKPFIPDGWTIEEDNGQTSFDPSDFALHLEPEQENSYLEGTVLRERLKGKNTMSAAVLDYLLEHPDLIPEEWKGKWVLFWGTVYRDSFGDPCVRCLYWRGGRWGWGSSWVGGDWNGNGPALVRASTQILETQHSDTLSLESRVAVLEAWMKRVQGTN